MSLLSSSSPITLELSDHFLGTKENPYMTMPSLASELLFTITVYTVLWAGFGTMHSLLASLWAKRLFGLSPATHRKVYNISATFVLAPILYYSYPGILLLFRGLLLQQLLIIPLIQFLLALLFLTLAVLLLMSFFSALGSEGVKGFLGLQEEPNTLAFQGPYKYCRHPIYTATFLATMGALLLSLTLHSITSSALISIYLLIGSTLEERRLRAEFPQYTEYVKNVGKFFPWKPLHLRFLKNSKLPPTTDS